MPKPPSPAQLAAQVETWNSQNPVGTKVVVRCDDGTSHITVTTSEAWVLSGHSAVILLKGISGCYLLNRVTAISADHTVEP
ncbi:hypothetical protein [Azospirillum argentinense]|uniref:Uncharacterized protein n=1 Tax=Azospirillum brasilense TaxID=192 RepID=A0A4D8QQ40_AZOBR|nr:hypothetical protein [Azospirillum argentinense]QCO07422.1 hypothetical protein D3867_36280 [Azospirillum argentinense]